MKHLDTILDTVGAALADTQAARDSLQANLDQLTPAVVQLGELARALQAEPEVAQAQGPDFTRLFVPAVGRIIERLRRERDAARASTNGASAGACSEALPYVDDRNRGG